MVMQQLDFFKPLGLPGPTGYGSKTYNSWRGMIQRCTNPNSSRYKYYGGRGITVCERWRSFANFLVDMGERPEGLKLERRDNDSSYCKNNCTWATQKEQNNNRRFVHIASARTKQSILDICE